MSGLKAKLACMTIAILSAGFVVSNWTQTHGQAPKLKGSARSEAIEAITRLGGFYSTKLEGSPEFMAMVTRLGYDERTYYNISTVSFFLNNPRAGFLLGDADLEGLASHLALFTQLELFDFRDHPFTARGIAALPPFPKLTTFRMHSLTIDDDIIDHLQKFPALTRLELEGTVVTAAGIEKIQRLLPACKVTR